MTLDGGDGDDRIDFRADRMDGTRLLLVDTVIIAGGDGDEFITVTNAKTATIDAGAGDDFVGVTILGPDSDSTFVISLGAGRDALNLNINEESLAYDRTGTIVTDFSSADDILYVTSLIELVASDGSTRYPLVGYTLGADPFATGHFRIQQQGSSTLFQVDRDGVESAHDFLTLVTLQNVNASTLTAGNINASPFSLTDTIVLDPVLSFAATILGTDAGDVITGTARSDRLAGLGGDDTLDGGDGIDSLLGGAGNDALDGGADADYLSGGAGDDSYVIDNEKDIVFEAKDEGNDTVRTGLLNYVLGFSVENLILTGSANSTGTGSDAANIITGNDGGNMLSGGAGDDTLDGGAGNDVVDGGAGIDRLTLGAGADTVRGVLADIAGDTLTDFSIGDRIVIQASSLTHADVNVTREETGTSLAIGAAKVGLAAGLTGGDIMVARHGVDSIVTYQGYLTTLNDRVAVNAGAINGIVGQAYLSGDTASTFIVTIEDTGRAQFANSIGVYEIDTATGEISGVRIIAADAGAGGTFTVTDVEAGHQLGVFLVQDGADRFDAALLGSTGLSLIRQGGALVLADNGTIVPNATIFVSHDQASNVDGAQHVLSGVASDGSGAIRLGFEDLTAGHSDRDYQDVILTVVALPKSDSGGAASASGLVPMASGMTASHVLHPESVDADTLFSRSADVAHADPIGTDGNNSAIDINGQSPLLFTDGQIYGIASHDFITNVVAPDAFAPGGAIHDWDVIAIPLPEIVPSLALIA